MLITPRSWVQAPCGPLGGLGAVPRALLLDCYRGGQTGKRRGAQLRSLERARKSLRGRRKIRGAGQGEALLCSAHHLSSPLWAPGLTCFLRGTSGRGPAALAWSAAFPASRTRGLSCLPPGLAPRLHCPQWVDLVARIPAARVLPPNRSHQNSCPPARATEDGLNSRRPQLGERLQAPPAHGEAGPALDPAPPTAHRRPPQAHAPARSSARKEQH